MYEQIEKAKENKVRAVANLVTKKNKLEQRIKLKGNRAKNFRKSGGVQRKATVETEVAGEVSNRVVQRVLGPVTNGPANVLNLIRENLTKQIIIQQPLIPAYPQVQWAAVQSVLDRLMWLRGDLDQAVAIGDINFVDITNRILALEESMEDATYLLNQTPQAGMVGLGVQMTLSTAERKILLDSYANVRQTLQTLKIFIQKMRNLVTSLSTLDEFNKKGSGGSGGQNDENKAPKFRSEIRNEIGESLI
ncbi:hypothetical protein J8M21_13485 [Pseudoalteromonas luteoviolacea]|uniref:hypothetical protein n=1 Tax=Pseudoalteromonas luteoviolacea TaxID=43657 RepID=UPI001B3A577A|nr:hypothetical protein [Pseudoalteromonas luteoviolacea]MBQ4878219.1 hypothetical protein [Pseudoalteromonas luteoviolacea]MBQ4907374.1 hypothetical protein [Pseudoalteromonas luteoviolacea]